MSPGSKQTGGRELSYQGRALSEWVSELDPHGLWIVGDEPPEVLAIRAIGTNGLPLLLKWITEKDPPGAYCLKPSRGMQAELAFWILGEQARPAIPELTHLSMTVLGRHRYERCINALASIGPDSLDGLITLIKSGSPGRRWTAIGSLAGMDTNAIVALPAVVECLVGKNGHVGWKAADELSRLYVPRSILLPYLTDSLQTASPAARVRILRCLLWIGPDARPALPAVYAAVSDEHPEVREAAARAAEVITRDPPQPRFKTRPPVSESSSP